LFKERDQNRAITDRIASIGNVMHNAKAVGAGAMFSLSLRDQAMFEEKSVEQSECAEYRGEEK
jgi:hypothetical protein